jgi:hypothetical protein
MNSEKIILICINSKDSKVESYIMNRETNSVLDKTNEILMPEVNFVDYSYDL